MIVPSTGDDTRKIRFFAKGNNNKGSKNSEEYPSD